MDYTAVTSRATITSPPTNSRGSSWRGRSPWSSRFGRTSPSSRTGCSWSREEGYSHLSSYSRPPPLWCPTCQRRPRGQETGHRPGLQPQQRWRGQPRQGDQGYSCRRMTARWPLVIFHNIIDVSAYNAFVIWREIHPDWMLGKRNKRRVFLQELGRDLVTPFIAQRESTPRTEAAAAVVRAVKATTAAALRPLYPGGARPKRPASIALAAAAPLGASKRKRCQMCPRKKDLKTHTVCRGCKKYICKGCSLVYCNMCA